MGDSGAGQFLGKVAAVLDAPSSGLRKLVNKNLPEGYQGIVEGGFTHGADLLKNPSAKVQKEFGYVQRGYEDVTGKTSQKKEAAAEAARVKVENDQILAQADAQTKTKNFNDAALANASSAQAAARAAQQVRARGSRSRRNTVLADSIGAPSAGNNGIKGYTTLIGGGV